MKDQQDLPPKPEQAPITLNVLDWAVLLAWLLGTLGSVASGFGRGFILHPEFAGSQPAIVANVLFGFFALISISFWRKAIAYRHGGQIRWTILVPVGFVFGMVMGGFLAREAFLSGYALSAALANEDVSYVYKVTDIRKSSGDCRNGVGFNNLPIGWDEICGIKPELFDRLRIGQLMVVTGKGNRYGVFPDPGLFKN